MKKVELHHDDYVIIYEFYRDIRFQLKKEYPVLCKTSKRETLKSYAVYTNSAGDVKLIRRNTVDHYRFYMAQLALKREGDPYYDCIGTLGSLLRTFPMQNSKKWFENWYAANIKVSVSAAVPSYKRMHHYCKVNNRVCDWGQSPVYKECHCRNLLEMTQENVD